MNFFQRIKESWTGQKDPDGVRSFTEDQKTEEAFDNIDRGIQCVPLDSIVGSVGRYHDFDGRFQPREHLPTDRYENIKQAMREGKRIPPVKLYQIKDEYFVLDGHHRIAAAATLCIVLGACSTPQPPVRWVKEGAGEAELAAARTACEERALKVQETSRGYSHTARGVEFMRCMREDGWEQVREESGDDS